MNTLYKKISQLFVVSSVFLAACTSLPKATEYSGKWKKINTFNPRINTIPLEKEYFFTALKIDSSLSAMLQRWASDVKIGLDYRCSNDYSISDRLFDTQTRSLSAAIEELNFVYTKHELNLSWNKEKSILIFSCGKYDKSNFSSDKLINDQSIKVNSTVKPVTTYNIPEEFLIKKTAGVVEQVHYGPPIQLNISSQIGKLN